MDYNFMIVLFKDKLKKKIIKKFKTFKKANSFYNRKIEESNNVIFEKTTENAIYSKYELALIHKESHMESIYTTDELGRKIKVVLEDDGFSIKKIDNYKIEEKIFDLQTKKKITVREMVSKYIDNKSMFMISSLNNKIIIQKDDQIDLFSLKNQKESFRLIDTLSSFFSENKLGSAIFVKDIDPSQRSFLYQILSEKGYNKKMLYRQTTTHSPRLK